MKWNGIVSQCEKIRMQARLASENSTQTRSTQAPRHGQENASRRAWPCQPTAGSAGQRPGSRASRGRNRLVCAGLASPASRGELVSLTAHRFDQVEAQLRAEPADAHVDHVRAGVEVIAPDRGE